MVLSKGDKIVLPDHQYVLERIILCNWDREQQKTISRRQYHLREGFTGNVLVLTWDELCRLTTGERV